MTLTQQRLRGGVGESAARPDGVPKVRGEFVYASDLREEGMLFGHTLRSPHPHALIRSIDASVARAMPGVRSVITERDLPTRERFGLMKRDQPVLAEGRVRYVGEAVAIVAADDIDQARAAAKAIRVEYEVLAPLSDPIAALRSDAPRLHDDGNVIDDALVIHGDPEAMAEVVVT
ncbi:MAG: xanthine dehydrogenase subunit D, partial [Chloroflexota bacterium]|nr:xanthine dehydrogenase subunit D [Chloroflexota bacterium]